ncbi:MAG: hypothetical protein IKN27_00785 [Selenomonadaceae bacterium]|nr:hypothetical protein [Selenomonadaceae bacterium]
MENKLQIFVNAKFGKIRVVMKDGEPHFVGKDVATALGYKDPGRAVREHVPDKFKGAVEMPSPGGVQNVVIINEAGMYKLVMRSKLESAEEFSDWVCGDVLTSIRKTGSYSVTPANNDIDSLAQAISKLADVERERLAFEREKLAFERDKLAVERDKLAFEREKFAVENGEDAKIFEAVQTLRELASAAGDEKYMRSKLVWLAANLLVDKNFIEGHEIIFKKCQ